MNEFLSFCVNMISFHDVLEHRFDIPIVDIYGDARMAFLIS